MEAHARSFKWFFGIVIVALLLPILAHLVLGSYNRALADDFCFTANAWSKGLWGTLDWHYNNWTGTYSSTFFQSVIGVSQSWRYTPIALIGLFSAACWWAAWQFTLTFRLAYRRYTGAALAFVLSFGVITGTANVFQSFYWTSGGITYAGPLIILVFYLGLLLAITRQEKPLRWWQFALAGGLPLLSGGFSPLYAVFQVTVFGLLILMTLRFASPEKKRRYLRLFGVSLLFALTALLILLIAPGNAIRQTAFEDLLPLSQVVVNTLVDTFVYIPFTSMFLSPMTMILPLVLAGVVAFTCHPLSASERVQANRGSLKWLGLTGLIGYILIASAFFTSLYSIGQLPPARAYVVPQIILVLMAMAWGYIMGLGLQKKHATTPRRLSPLVMAAVLVLVVFSAAQPAQKTLALLPDFRVFASEWDARDAFLTTTDAQGAAIEIQAFTQDLATYAWLDNPYFSCIRDYYHQPTLVILDPPENTESP